MMMTYFEVKARLECLQKFRDHYVDYIEFTNRPKNIPAQMTLQKMEPLAPMVVESLKKVGLGRLVAREAPASGGRRIRVNLIKAIFREHVVRHFSVQDKEPLEILEQGLLAYRNLLWRQQLQLFNPIYWLFHFGDFIARLPIQIFRAAGYDTTKAEDMASVKFYLVSFQLLYFYLIADAVGFIEWLRFDIIAVLLAG
jgi:hypothetical protein